LALQGEAALKISYINDFFIAMKALLCYNSI